LGIKSITVYEKGLTPTPVECWSNGSVPADPADLAKWLSWSIDDVKAGLTDRVRSFFEEVNGELISPQLEKHYQKHRGSKKGMSEGGRKGALRRWKKEDESIGTPLPSLIGTPLPSLIGTPSGAPLATSIGGPIGTSMGSLNTINFNSFKSNSVFKEESNEDDFVAEIEAEEYKRRSRGE
jgi:hypothetical protein